MSSLSESNCTTHVTGWPAPCCAVRSKRGHLRAPLLRTPRPSVPRIPCHLSGKFSDWRFSSQDLACRKYCGTWPLVSCVLMMWKLVHPRASAFSVLFQTHQTQSLRCRKQVSYCRKLQQFQAYSRTASVLAALQAILR